MHPLIDKLRAGESALGAFCCLGNVEAVELACHAGYDFVLIDWQHGPFNDDQMRESVRAAHATDCMPVARPPSHGRFPIEWILDAGYPALLAPMVNSAAEAQAIVQAAYYPPLGTRSQAGCRASLHYGRDYRKRFNDEFLLMVMIEHAEAVENIEAIAAVPGVSGCYIGSTDLASSMGAGEQTPAFEAAVAQVLKATNDAGKIPGIATIVLDQFRRRCDQGFRFITYQTDRRLLEKVLAEARKEAAG